jgi:hypothetical protein
MKLKNYKIAGIAALAFGFASAAQAGFVTTDLFAPGASTINVVPNNEFKGLLASLGVKKYTTGVQLGVDDVGSVSYYYYGKEAGFQNVFLAEDLLYTTNFTPTTQNYFAHPVSIGSVDVSAGSLDFAFCAFASPLSLQGCVTNGWNDHLTWNANQSIAYNVSGNTAWLFWDDSGAGPDDNHDDMIIKAVFTPKAVPEPATLGLFGLGLLAVWAGARRRAVRKI